MRATSFKSRPTEEWTNSAQALSSTTLFLVARIGPTVFTLKDEQDVLRVPIDHSLCYQSSLTDNELDQVLDGIPAAGSSRRAARPRITRPVAIVSEDVAKETCVPRQPLVDGEDNTCTICMDEMTADQALTWCRAGCGQNIHAKCMMKCAQHNITNRLQITCPLCRNPMDLDTLKQDCKGKASLKQTYAPVQCANCKCNQRGTFYRCVECSQVSCQGSGKPLDFCPECFERQLDTSHSTHHFVRSDIVTEASHGLEWAACKNPAMRGVITNPQLIRELQTRELGVNDYELLLSLSDGGPTPELPTLCVESLPLYNKSKGGKKSVVKSLCWCAAAQSPSRIQSNIVISSGSTGAATLTTAGAALSPVRSDGTSSGESSPNREHRMMRILPCRHVAHDRCLRDDLAMLIEEDSAKIPEYRCAHPECGKRIFIGLSRKRKCRKAAATETSAAGSGKVTAADAGMNAQETFGMPGIVGASCFGSGVPGGTLNSTATRVNRLTHRRGRNSFGSGSDFSAGSGSIELGVTGAAPQHYMSSGAASTNASTANTSNSHTYSVERSHLANHRPAHLEALPGPSQTLRTHTPEYGAALAVGLVGGVHAGFAGSGSHSGMVAARRPPVGRRVRLRALGDAAGAGAESGVKSGLDIGATRVSATALDATILGLGTGRSASPLGSLSDRAPSPEVRLGTHHQRALSLGSQEFPALGLVGNMRPPRGKAADVLVFNLSKESRQRQRERNRPPPPAYDPTLMVASISLSNPGQGSSAAAVGTSTAGYPLRHEGVAAVGLDDGNRPNAGRKPGGRIVRGLVGAPNRASEMSESAPLPTLG